MNCNWERKQNELLSSIFSDETELFRSPSEPEPGDVVTVRIRTAKGGVSRAVLLAGDCVAIMMEQTKTDAMFDYYEAGIVCLSRETSYSFALQSEFGDILYDKLGARFSDVSVKPPKEYAFRFTPGFHVPQWAKGALQYQIFPDRFCNGNAENDVSDYEYYYATGHSRHVQDWDAPPTDSDIRRFYGGDLQGILSRLDYLQSLGVEVIYLNPIFVSPSSHKYDTQDYSHVDPHLSVIAEDMDHSMESWEKHNGFAPKYIKRTTAKVNLEASDAFFALFCEQVHKRGMKIILDGVFNHCGSFSKWMDREGIYLNKQGYEKGAYQSADSPYREYFLFRESGNPRYGEYESWWGYPTLPKLNYEGSEKLREEIFAIAESWASPPYSIDGWRLDVAADLGHSLDFNHAFWKEFRKRVKVVNPDILILAEHYGSPSDWLHGDQWDTVMNYDAFMEPVSYFLTGMEKHSDEFRPDYHRDGERFFDTMFRTMAAFESPSLMCAMNQLSNHDHSRFLTRTNRTVGRTDSVGPKGAEENISLPVLREAVLIQMTWPGAPTIYYADEAGQVGWTDPDSRRTYPWGHEDGELIEYHRKLAELRNEIPVLKTGSLKKLFADTGIISYARFDGEQCAVIVCNHSEETSEVTLRVCDAGIVPGEKLLRCLQTTKSGFTVQPETLSVEGSEVTITLAPESAVLYVKES